VRALSYCEAQLRLQRTTMGRFPDFMDLDFGKLTWAGWLVLLGTVGVFVGCLVAVGTLFRMLGWNMPDNRAAKVTIFVPVLLASAGFFWGCRRLFEAGGITVYRD
jgi:hypothetical protein